MWRLTLLVAGLAWSSARAEPLPEHHNPLEAFQNAVWEKNTENVVSAYNISFSVNQTLLPSEGGWVDVSWSNVPYPGSDDLVALFVPADANPRETSFAKYQWAIASQDHLAHGSGSLRFRLLNMRSEVRFAFIRNPKEWSVVAAVTDIIRFDNLNAPLQGHLALTGIPGEMLVQWTTRGVGRPLVRLGTKPGRLEQVLEAYESVTYSREEMCGPPASTVGYVHPGMMHRVLLQDLQPDTRYFYQYGAEDFGFSTESSFLTAPLTGPEASVKLLAIADMGQADIDGSNEAMQYWPSRYTTDLMQRDMEDRRLLLHLGDISYARGYTTQWDVFMDQIEPLARSMPYMTALGNHERDWPGSGDRFPSMYDSGGECGVPTERRFKMPGPAEDKPWYSFDYGPIHFTIYSTEHHFHHGSEQHDFMRADLASVNRSRTPWLVVGGHRPFYIDSTSAGKVDSDQTVADDLRMAFEDLFLQHAVDLTLHGHHHSYQRSCPVFEGSCQVDLDDGSAAAPVHLVIGHAGATTSPNLLPEQPSFWHRVDLVHGFLRIEANATVMTCEMVEDLHGKVMDSFSLQKPRGWLPRNPHAYQQWRPGSRTHTAELDSS